MRDSYLAESSVSQNIESAASVLKHNGVDLHFSKRSFRRAEAIEIVRTNRCAGTQIRGFASRPFVLCGLPVKRPPAGCLLHERRNGHFFLQVAGHPQYGLPWGQDRLVPFFLATLAVRQQSRTVVFESAAEMLDTFGLQQGGSQYRRLVASFLRVFGATIFFGTDIQRRTAAVVNQARFNFMSKARIWFARNPSQESLPHVGQNVIVLSEEFHKELGAHPIPADLNAAKALSSSPAAFDLFMWLSHRCFLARGAERVPIFGDFGLANQLGSGVYARRRKFRERLEQWLRLVRVMWPECPARVSNDGLYLTVDRAQAVTRQEDARGRA
jgi:hypothetical protein